VKKPILLISIVAVVLIGTFAFNIARKGDSNSSSEEWLQKTLTSPNGEVKTDFEYPQAKAVPDISTPAGRVEFSAHIDDPV